MLTKKMLAIIFALGLMLVAAPAMAVSIAINDTATGSSDGIFNAGAVTVTFDGGGAIGTNNGLTIVNESQSLPGSVDWNFYFAPSTHVYGDFRYNMMEPGTNIVSDTIRIILSPNHNNATNDIGEVIFVSDSLDGTPGGLTPLNLTLDAKDSANVTGTISIPLTVFLTSFDETGRGQSIMGATNSPFGSPFTIGPVSVYIGSDVEAVPEPYTMLLLGSGLIGLAVYGRKKSFKK